MAPALNLSREQIDALEAANGLRQAAEAMEVVRYYLDPERPFMLRPNLLQHLQAIAVDGLEESPGRWRTTPVRITGSAHTPPPPHMVENHVRELCDYINDNFHERTAFHLAAYIMWRLNWIHPFTDGNGRTSRALSYTVLCVKVGYILPGVPTIPEQIQADRTPYIRALEAADAKWVINELDLSVMETMLKSMLATQLLAVIDKAGGSTAFQ